MSWTRIRIRTAMAALLVIALGAWLGMGWGSLCYFKIGFVRFLCPLGFFEVCVNDGVILWRLLPYALFGIAAAMLVGRALCGWLCPYGFVAYAADSLLQKMLPRRVDQARLTLGASLRARFRKLSYKDGLALLLGGMAATFIFKYPVFSTICPIGIVTRNTISLFKNLRLHADLLLLAIPFVVGFLFVGGWRSCCPVGVLQGITAHRHKFLIPEVELDACAHCGACTQVCPFNARLDEGEYDEHLCVKCLSCLENCPHRAIHIRWVASGHSRKEPNAPADRTD